MKRLIVSLTAFGLLAVGCAEGGAQSLGPVGTGTPRPSSTRPAEPTRTPTAEPSPEPTGETVSYEVWFATGNGLFVTRRTQPATLAVGRAALTALLEGPNRAERRAGVFTAVPDRTELLGLSIEGGIATVDLSGDYEGGGGSASMFMRLAQVVYTITQFDSVDAVNFLLDGREIGEFFSEAGIVIDRPQTRRDYRDQLPPILVENLLIGQRVSSPVAISGSANVFEATVSISILNEDGEEIVRTFTTATCGTGCRGTYSKNVRYDVDHAQPGTIMVFESSAEDGSPLFVVSIPVKLSA